MMKEKTLLKKIARLQSKMDVLETELTHLHFLLKKCGFPKGLHSLKNCIQELLAEKKKIS